STAPITRDQPKRGASVDVQCSFVGVRLGKSRGPAQRGLALFRFTFVRTKVNPGPGQGGPMVAPRPPGDGRISPASARCAGPAGAKQKRDLQRKLPLISTPAGGQGGKATSAAPAAPP